MYMKAFQLCVLLVCYYGFTSVFESFEVNGLEIAPPGSVHVCSSA